MTDRTESRPVHAYVPTSLRGCGHRFDDGIVCAAQPESPIHRPINPNEGRPAEVDASGATGVGMATSGPTIESLQAEIAALREALDKAAKKFREYETLHMAKNSIDGDAKARTNAQMAEMCEAAIKGTSDET